MASNLYIQQYVSTDAPIGAVLGDEWLNPKTGRLNKQTIINGSVGWLDITPVTTVSSQQVVSSSPSLTAGKAIALAMVMGF
jgi:hypothetical protein